MKASLESLEFEVSGFSSYKERNGNTVYTVDLSGDEGSLYLHFDSEPPTFLSKAGNSITIVLTDKSDTSKTEDIGNVASFYPGNFVSHGITATATSKSKKEQATRSTEYAMSVLDNGHVSKPEQYEDVAVGEFADPVNFNYPMNNKARAEAALKYFAIARNYGSYSAINRLKVWGRMKSLASKYIKDVDGTPPWKREEG